MSGRKPVAIHLGIDLTTQTLSYNGTKSFLQWLAFWGFYPSMPTLYFQNETIIARDRALFMQYLPLIDQANSAQWATVPAFSVLSTLTNNSIASVYVERFGLYPNMTLNLRFTSALSASTGYLYLSLTSATTLRIGRTTPIQARDLSTGAVYPFLNNNGNRTLQFTQQIPAGTVMLLQIEQIGLTTGAMTTGTTGIAPTPEPTPETPAPTPTPTSAIITGGTDRLRNSSSGAALAGWAVALIVIFIIFFLCIIVLVVYFVWRRFYKPPVYAFDLEARKEVPKFPELKDITVIRKLGGGVGGQVFLGSWNSAEVALKFIADADMTLLEKEASLLYGLMHPNVVRFLGRSSIQNEQYIVMEYCEGGELLSLLRRQGGKIRRVDIFKF